MTPEEASRLTAVEERSKSNTHRLDEMTEKIDEVHRLVTAMEVLAVEQKHIAENITKVQSDVSTLKSQVKEIEQKPVKKWEGIAEKIAKAVIAALVGFLFAKLGLV